MNKTAIKNFAIWSRKKLISDIKNKAGLVGITEAGIAAPLPQSTRDVQFFDIGTKDYAAVRGEDIRKRAALVNAIQTKQKDCPYADAFRFVVEKAAYTWFNRLIAIRFMEVNDYLPSRVRVLSSENPGKAEPDMVTRPGDTDMEFTEAEHDHIGTLWDENQLDELFRFLFIKQCRKLHEVLPELFDDDQSVNQPDSYLDFLLTLSYTDQDGVLWHLVHDIPEKDFRIRTPEDDERQKLENIPEEDMPAGQVEIIGWLYQYYNTEPKDRVFANLKKNIKISKDDIPAATQLFTPDWIVRYMVENSLGRLWIEHLKAVEESGTLDLSAYGIKAHTEGTGLVIDDGPIDISGETLRINSDFDIKKNWKYYLEDAKQEPEVQAQLAEIRKQYATLKPEEIRVIDPCMGSGHILVRLFDVLMQIYDSQGWTARDAARSIVENNLYGLDIDDRAAQLAYFAVMMKARQYDRRFLEQGIRPHVYGIQESNNINRNHLNYLGRSLSSIERNNAVNQINNLLDEFIDAKEYGSILQPQAYDWALLSRFVEDTTSIEQISLEETGLEVTQGHLWALIAQVQTLSQKYHVAVTNPPYMGSGNMGDKLSKYAKDNYPDEKNDLFAVFIKRVWKILAINGYFAMITQHAWMFLSGFEKLRTALQTIDMVNMAHLGARAFEEIGGEVVQTTSFVMKSSHIPQFKGIYCRLTTPTTQQGKEDLFLSGQNRYTTNQDNFSKIPGHPIAYWISESCIELFESKPPLSDFFIGRVGLMTTDNDRYLRFFWEVSYNRICFTAKDQMTCASSKMKYFPHNKGGSYRKWAGNRDYIVDWENNGERIKKAAIEKYPYLHGNPNFVVHDDGYYFRENVSWSEIAMSNLAFRYYPSGFTYNVKGMSAFPQSKYTLYELIAFCNSVVCSFFAKVINPSISFGVNSFSNIPFIAPPITVTSIAKQNIKLSCEDWDSFETSWDFQRHPLLPSPEKSAPPTTGEQSTDLDEKRMEFAVFCIENLAEDLGQDATAIFDLLTRESDLLYSYVIPCYEPLHSQDKTYIVDDIKGVMWERGLLP